MLGRSVFCAENVVQTIGIRFETAASKFRALSKHAHETYTNMRVEHIEQTKVNICSCTLNKNNVYAYLVFA